MVVRPSRAGCGSEGEQGSEHQPREAGVSTRLVRAMGPRARRQARGLVQAHSWLSLRTPQVLSEAQTSGSPSPGPPPPQSPGEASHGKLRSGALGPTLSSSSYSSKGNRAPQGSPWFLQSLASSPAPALTPETKDGSAPDPLRTWPCQHLGLSVVGGSPRLIAAPHSQVQARF